MRRGVWLGAFLLLGLALGAAGGVYADQAYPDQLPLLAPRASAKGLDQATFNRALQIIHNDYYDPRLKEDRLALLRNHRDFRFVKLDLAGVRAEDVHVQAEGRRLTVSGSRRDCCLEEGCSYYRMEIAYSHFQRSLDLPCDLSRCRITTDYRAGMLHVHIITEKEQ